MFRKCTESQGLFERVPPSVYSGPVVGWSATVGSDPLTEQQADRLRQADPILRGLHLGCVPEGVRQLEVDLLVGHCTTHTNTRRLNTNASIDMR